MSIPLIPWEPSNIPDSIQEELNRRKTNRGFKDYISPHLGEWDINTGDWSKYKGPMMPWVRFCSNSAGLLNKDKSTIDKKVYDKQGFVFYGGKDFYKTYGFPKPRPDDADKTYTSIIGRLPNGDPHIIDNDTQTSNYPIHVPSPEIERISVTIQKELYRRASIEWVCFSSKQLEYMTPYFLVPGITCILEWGWNHFSPSSLIDLDDINSLKELKNNPYQMYIDNIIKSRGNYDILFGVITHFEWNIEGNKIHCKTEITSPDRIYAGLTVDSTVTSHKPNISKTEEVLEDNITILNTLKTFVKDDLKNVRDLVTLDNSVPANLSGFVSYLQSTYPDKWKEIAYGIYFGRDISEKIDYGSGTWAPIQTQKTVVTPSKDKVQFDAISKLYDNKHTDFDRKNQDNTWVNLGMLIEILNYHVYDLKGFKNKAMFKIDINDVVISGHPNLISTNGKEVLFPNAESPKYFYGNFSADVIKDKLTYEKQENSSKIIYLPGGKPIAKKNNALSDWRVYKVCNQTKGKCLRDDNDEIINSFRYTKLGNQNSFSFPFIYPQPSGYPNVNPYPARYSGYLKNIYFSIKKFEEIVLDDNTKTYTDIITKILNVISNAGGGLWDFRLVNSTGKSGLKKEELATMKIVDYKFISSINTGKVYTFDYFDSDSLLQNIKFTPTITNSQTIRTMYAATNNPQNRIVLSDQNELLNYHVNDRLVLDDTIRYSESNTKVAKSAKAFTDMMGRLQNLIPQEESYQVTTLDDNGKILIRRLAMPSPELLKLLLDDGDEDNNPRYTGIMPGLQAQFTIQGIGGLRTFMMFLVRNLPKPYSHKDIVFRIIDLTENIERGKWTTTITAGIIPLRKAVKNRLGIAT